MESQLACAKAGKVVSIRYTLSTGDGEVVDASGDEPLQYLHGQDNIIAGLERQIDGHCVGDKFEAIVSPEDGYGERRDNAERALPRSAFPEAAELDPGAQFAAETQGGELVSLRVLRLEGDKVVVDTNHPLAGETLTFEVEVVGVRDATAEESSHGHVHGPGCAH